MAQDWQMPRPGSGCCTCAREFGTGEAFRVCLHETPAGYERRDYCATCSPAGGAEVIATWKTRRPPPAPKKGPSFDPAAIFRFFQRLEGADGPGQVQLRFVLALLLWRKKILRLERSVAGGAREEWEFSERGSDATHRVIRPELADDELERLSGQLELLLAGAPLELEAVATEQEEQADDRRLADES